MLSCTWILLLLASHAATRAQELNLQDAFDDDKTTPKPTVKPTVNPAPPQNPNPADPKKPFVVPPKTEGDKKKPSGDELNLSEALGPDPEPKKPVVPPKEKGTGGGSFGDSDLIDVNEGGEYMPDGGRSGGRGADVQSDDSSDKPEGGALAAIISSVGVALLGAASSYFAYQKKKLCFKGEDPESGKSQETQSEPQVLSNLLNSS